MNNCIFISDEFKKVNTLYHFTTFEIFKKILDSGSFFMTPLGPNLNDKNEVSYLTNYSKGKVFISCFTASLNEKFWSHNDYAKSCESGVCIAFDVAKLLEVKIMSCSYEYLDYSDRMIFNYDKYENTSDYRIRNLVFDKVKYKKDPMEDYTFDSETFHFFENVSNINETELIKYCKGINNSGFVKTILDANGNDQSYENEYRILARILHKGSELKWQEENKKFPKEIFDRLLLDIKPLISSFVIIVKKQFTSLNEIEELAKNYNFKYEII